MQTLTEINRETIQKRIIEDWSKYATDQEVNWILENIPIIVDRKGIYGFNEGYLGLGYAYSVTDYGRATNLSDNEIISMVKKELLEHGNQLCHLSVCVKREPMIINGKPSKYVTTSTYQLCDQIVIMVSKMGYAPKPVIKKVN